MMLLKALSLELNFYRILGINSALIKNQKFVSNPVLLIIQITFIASIVWTSNSGDVLNGIKQMVDLMMNHESQGRVYVTLILFVINFAHEKFEIFVLLIHRWYKRKEFDELYNNLMEIDRTLRRNGLDDRYENSIKHTSVRQILFILIGSFVFSVMTYYNLHSSNFDPNFILEYSILFLTLVIKNSLFLQFYTVMTTLRKQVRQLYADKHNNETLTEGQLNQRLEIHELIVATAMRANDIFGVQMFILTMAYFFQMVLTLFESFVAYQDSVLSGLFTSQLIPFLSNFLQLFLEVQVCTNLKGEVIAVVNDLEKSDKTVPGMLLLSPGQHERDFGFSIKGFYKIDEYKSFFKVSQIGLGSGLDIINQCLIRNRLQLLSSIM